MRRSKYLFKIDKPCNADWSSMTTNSQGKFCADCSKSVIDFSSLNDSEVMKLIGSAEGNLCGRFNRDQLNRLLVQSSGKTGNSSIYKILTGLLLLSAPDTFAQTNREVAENVKSVVESKDHKTLIKQVKRPNFSGTSSKVFEGKIISDATNDPLANCSVGIKNTKAKVLTDADGKFKFVIPDSLLTDKIRFEISSIGHRTMELSVNKNDLPVKKNIIMKELTFLMGKVAIIKCE